ncbi:hypothetical protein GGI20_005009 [Coemansia sp. BCRC 34301]|nr:hypothetical protein GGI20_005009 [Coemansia sp. BCRC 34301]
MVKVADGFHTPYSAMRTADLESEKFLDSICPGLSSYKDGKLELPEAVASELAEALERFESGVWCIYKEDEFKDGERLAGSGVVDDIAIDSEGWGPGVLETVLWDRRKSRSEQRRWRRAQDKQHCGKMVCSMSDVSESSTGEEEGSSSNDSSSPESDSASSDASTDSGSSRGSSSSSQGSMVARPTSINKALGSDNVGFKMLAKLGWQQGQGLGAAGNGIVEPIRLATRFSTVRGVGRGRGRGRQRGRGQARGVVERASLGTGRKPALQQQLSPSAEEDNSADDFESYRKQMSTVYKNSASRAQQHDDKP